MDGRAMRKAHGCVGFPLVDTRARFLIPSRFDDEVTVATQVTACRRSSFDVHHRLLKGGELAVEGFETRVWVVANPEDAERIKAHPLPAAVIATLGGEANPGSEETSHGQRA
jgi:4-hydroxybenzoyl-CoA thioesterase